MNIHTSEGHLRSSPIFELLKHLPTDLRLTSLGEKLNLILIFFVHGLNQTPAIVLSEGLICSWKGIVYRKSDWRLSLHHINTRSCHSQDIVVIRTPTTLSYID